MKLGGLRPGTLRHNTAAKERATREAEKLRGVLRPMAAAGLSLRDMAAALEGAGKTTKAGNQLSPTQVKRLLERLGIEVG